jgi:hypothetical protein
MVLITGGHVCHFEFIKIILCRTYTVAYPAESLLHFCRIFGLSLSETERRDGAIGQRGLQAPFMRWQPTHLPAEMGASFCCFAGRSSCCAKGWDGLRLSKSNSELGSAKHKTWRLHHSASCVQRKLPSWPGMEYWPCHPMRVEPHWARDIHCLSIIKMTHGRGNANFSDGFFERICIFGPKDGPGKGYSKRIFGKSGRKMAKIP